MKKLTLAIIALLLLPLLLVSCSPAAGSVMISYGQAYSGGEPEEKNNVNIKDISISQQEDDTVVTLYFVYGSRVYADEDEAKMTNVPQYALRCLESPYRIVLDIENIGYWDYEEHSLAGAGLISGVFRQIPAENRPFSLYLQLNQKAGFSIKEDADKLILTLKGEGVDEGEKYYVYANCFDEYVDGDLPRDILDDFTPVLCDDFSSTVIISRGFGSEDEANAYKDTAEKLLTGTHPGKKMYVAKLAEGQAPAYNDTGEESAKKVIEMIGRGPTSLPVLMTDGRYLCSTPDGKLMLFARSIQSEISGGTQSGDNADFTMEALWTMDSTSGKKARITDMEFYPVMDAEFSPDGSKLAFTTQQEDNAMVLGLYDMTTGDLRELNEEGLGSTVVGFAWGSGNIIYCMSGEEDALQPMKYDLNMPEGERVSSVEEQQAAATEIVFLNGDLYFNDAVDTKDRIYRLRPDTFKREEFAEGADFKISPDGKWMAIQESAVTPEGEECYNFKIKDIGLGSETVFLENANIYDYCWSADSSTLYFLRDASNAEQSGYPMLLCSYAPKTDEIPEIQEIAKLKAEEI
ncbi:MAG: hypothetical protein Q8O09_04120, partial [Bacillota bacterium]|nr:hypothetical protein [Bacillota bacterium]